MRWAEMGEREIDVRNLRYGEDVIFWWRVGGLAGR
jgi:hypothetical protein